jgi:Mg2+ and Co2+ transporter CorA
VLRLTFYKVHPQDFRINERNAKKRVITEALIRTFIFFKNSLLTFKLSSRPYVETIKARQTKVKAKVNIIENIEEYSVKFPFVKITLKIIPIKPNNMLI